MSEQTEIKRHGRKQKQAWTRSALERARRGAPGHIIEIKPDGTIRIVPPSIDQNSPLGEWRKAKGRGES